MPASHNDECAPTRTYVQRLWREHPGALWRAALRPGDGAVPLGFADLPRLASLAAEMEHARLLRRIAADWVRITFSAYAPAT